MVVRSYVEQSNQKVFEFSIPGEVRRSGPAKMLPWTDWFRKKIREKLIAVKCKWK